MSALLACHGLTKAHDGRTLFEDLSLSVGEGERLGLVGPNGAGKSTLLSAIAGTVRAAHGRIEMDGEILSGLGPESVARRGLSMVPEGRRIFAGLTVRENLMVGTGLRRDRGAVGDDLETVFTAFPILRDRAGAPAGALSGGQQQMLAIARALMPRPRLLLLDEPSLGLAPLLVDDLLARLRLVAEAGTAVLLAEQNIGAALGVATRGVLLAQGRVAASGPASELRAAPDLARLAMGLAR